MERPTSSGKILIEKVAELYDRIINPALLVRRLTLSINHLMSEDLLPYLTKSEILTDVTDTTNSPLLVEFEL